MSNAPGYRATLGRGGRIGYFVGWRLIRGLCAVLFRLEIVGRENLPADDAYILSAVHRSYLDTPFVGMVRSRRLRFLGKEGMWSNRFVGWLLTVLGGFPVERGTADRAALRACRDVLVNGEPLVMFPEGTRQEGPLVRRELLHDGPAFLSARSGVPLVPVGIGGSDRAWAPGARFPRPAKVVVVIGRPIPAPTPLEGRVSRRAVRELTDDLCEGLQEVYDDARGRVP